MNTENKVTPTPEKTYIKSSVIIKLGKEIAETIAKAYNSDNAQEKLQSTIEIINLPNLKEEAKIKFIGDLMIRPKRERKAISRKLYKLLEENK